MVDSKGKGQHHPPENQNHPKTISRRPPEIFIQRQALETKSALDGEMDDQQVGQVGIDVADTIKEWN